ncbi:lumazine synthase [Coemansia furcata]|uniref:Lumazine synthase n=1 Tax=Coemansia furcata TaxID=417177 RepID=A0ACC1L8U2_9FUNG|nr:lumazine synthase [Coemansia furcata]
MGGDDFHKGVKEPSTKLDGSALRILIVHTRWNSEIVDPLVEGSIAALIKYGVKRENITVRDVPGAFELPGAAQRLIRQSQQHQSQNLILGSPQVSHILPFDAAICVGVLIKGSTMHFEYIADATTHGIMKVGLETGVPVVFGVLTCLTEEQAMQRAGIGKGEDKGHNHGTDWGSAAVEMALLGL